MDEIYEACNKILNKKILSERALLGVLNSIARGTGRSRQHTKYDSLVARARNMNYRAAGRGTVTAQELHDLLEKQKHCVLCGSDQFLVFDHIKSLYRGGTNTIDNLQVLCRKCNMEKGVGN